jgi:hypothetical protein
MDEDTDDGMEEGRELTVLVNPLAKLTEEELAELEELPGLTDKQMHQLTVVNTVTLSDEDFKVTEANLLYSKALRYLEQAANSDDVLGVMGWSERWELYTKQVNDKPAQAFARRVRMRAIRNLGLMWKAQEKSKGGRPYLTGSGADPVNKPTKPASLAEYGIKKRLADKMRKYAALSEDKYQELEDEAADRVENPKPKSPKLEPAADPSKGMDLGMLGLIMSDAAKEILNHKSRRLTNPIRRADLQNVVKECHSLAAAIEEVWDEIKEEGVIEVSPTLDAEGT